MQSLGPGNFPDILARPTGWWVSFGVPRGPLLLIALSRDLTPVRHDVIAPDDSHAFPKLWGSDYLAYREGPPFYHARVRRYFKPLDLPLGPCAGNDPILIAHGYVYWQTPDWRVWKQSLVEGPKVLAREDGAPDGLSRVLADGTVRLVREDRFSVQGMTRPHVVTPEITIGEHPLGGILVKRLNRPDRWLLPNEDTLTPRGAVNGSTLAIVTSGTPGVRVLLHDLT